MLFLKVSDVSIIEGNCHLFCHSPYYPNHHCSEHWARLGYSNVVLVLDTVHENKDSCVII
jgi:hypothetical protein